MRVDLAAVGCGPLCWSKGVFGRGWRWSVRPLHSTLFFAWVRVQGHWPAQASSSQPASSMQPEPGTVYRTQPTGPSHIMIHGICCVPGPGTCSLFSGDSSILCMMTWSQKSHGMSAVQWSHCAVTRVIRWRHSGWPGAAAGHRDSEVLT